MPLTKEAGRTGLVPVTGRKDGHFLKPKQMISEEEYERAQAIINEYQRERQQQAEFELEEDDPMNYEDEDEIEERRENERFERALNCTCGAWIINQNKVLHVADCICGAE